MDVITIVIDVYPATGSKPATVVVAATPKDGTPHFASGPFADRHKLLDQAYGEAAKRSVKADARKASKPKAGKGGKSGKAGKAGSTPAFGEPGHLKAAAAEADQIGPADNQETPTPLVEPPADLPVIEGDASPDTEFVDDESDDEKQLELTLEGGNE